MVTHQMTELPKPPGVNQLFAYGVNDTPWVVGVAGGAFVYDVNAGQYIVTVPALVANGGASFNSINSKGIACGTRAVSLSPSRTNAMIWSIQNGVTDLGLINGANTAAVDINDAGQLCGWTGSQLSPLSFIYSGGQYAVFGPVPGGINCDPNGINNLGDIIAGGNTSVAYRWNRAFQPLPPLDADFNLCGALSLNDAGRIVGLCKNHASPPVNKLVLWMNAEARDLTQMVVPVNGLSLDYADGISSAWTILANAHYNGHNAAVVLRPVMPIAGDTDCNSIVNIDDIVHVITAWGPCSNCSADVNANQTVNIDDLVEVITHWTP